MSEGVQFSLSAAQRTGAAVLKVEAMARRGVRREAADYGSPLDDAGAFPVLVKQNGVDGSSDPLYDLYDLADSGFATKLNLSGALAPGDSRARVNAALTVTAASNGSVGMAYFDASGAIALDSCPETNCVSS